MKFFLLSILITLGFSSAIYSQTTVCLGEDIELCVGTTVNIDESCGVNGGVNSSVIQLSNPQTISLSDDEFSAPINIGFNFKFYGNVYSQFIASDNGYISFNVADAGGYASYATTTLPISNPTSILNTISTPWQDLYMINNGTINLETVGVAPNRRCVIYFDGLSMYDTECQTAGECFSGSIILNETSNIIETHIANKEACTSWNDGFATHGLNNIDGTIAHVVPGRNNTVWTAQNEGTEFSPNSATDYSINNIPFKIVTTNSSGVVWTDTDNNSYPYNNGVLETTVQSGTVGYFLATSTCGVGVGSVSSTTFITGISSSVDALAIDDMCSASIGEVSATPTSGIPIHSFNWPSLGANTQTVTNVPAGSYTVNMTDGNGCVSSATAVVGDTPALYQGTSTEVSCPTGNDGTAMAEMVPALGNITYQWDDPAGQTTSTAVNLAAGTYNCTITSDVGCSNIVTVEVTELPGMIGNIVNVINVSCYNGNNGSLTVEITQGTSPYTYSWDHSASSSATADDLIVGSHKVTITDAKGCIITATGVLTEPLPLNIDFLTADTQICPEENILLEVIGSGGSTDYTFTWTENGNVIGTGLEILVDPVTNNTEYCVELSEACGSPTTNECVKLSFPTPIEPSALPDMTAKCVPDTFYFENTSTNPAEIASTFWEFGDNISHTGTSNGVDPISHYYNTPGFQTITLTTTSIYGCVYVDSMVHLIEVVSSPIADFNFSNNPTTIFETGILMQDKSSFDVVDWQWFSPGSSPNMSSANNPAFMFPENEVNNYPVTLVVTNDRGCTDTTTYILQVVEDILFFAPNAFTPDGNEFNNSWKPEISGIDIYDFDLFIFNRWGQIIWENHDPSKGWDGTYKGKLVANDTYVWIATVKNPYNDDKVTFNGTMVLLSGDSKFFPE